MNKGNVKALLPIGVFLVLYLGLGFLFEYGLKIPMGFYSIPIVVIFLIALFVACCQNRALPLDEKLVLMGRGVGDKNIIIMVLIFLTAGLFVGVVGRSSADSVAYFLLSIIPPQFAVAVLFVVSCFVSLAMGTSVGTITLITPIALSVAGASGFSPAMCVAAVLGGGMFGDNLSFISDTTIAACNGQGCPMKDKFRVNFAIALPAALVTLGLLLICSAGQAGVQAVIVPGVVAVLVAVKHRVQEDRVRPQLFDMVHPVQQAADAGDGDIILVLRRAAQAQGINLIQDRFVKPHGKKTPFTPPDRPAGFLFIIPHFPVPHKPISRLGENLQKCRYFSAAQRRESPRCAR